jgi:preprotein translocase subunit YajC
MGKGQVWSIDILLAVVIFVSVILIFYVTMIPRQKPQMKDLETESGALKLELEKNNEFGFLVNDEVNDAKLQH